MRHEPKPWAEPFWFILCYHYDRYIKKLIKKYKSPRPLTKEELAYGKKLVERIRKENE